MVQGVIVPSIQIPDLFDIGDVPDESVIVDELEQFLQLI